MSASEKSSPADKAWVKPVCAVGGVAVVCGTGAYLVSRTGGAEMVKALVPALAAVVVLAK
jgi:hypothetical protein